MKNIAIAGVLGGIVVFVWSFISWVVLPWHNAVIHNIPSGEQVVEILKNDQLPAGLYHHPGFMEGETDMAAWTERYKRGPNINFLVYAPVGGDPMDPMQFLTSLILNILSAGLAAFLLLGTLQRTPGLPQRALYIAGLGLFVTLSATLMDWNWWNFPSDYSLVLGVDALITWFLAGLVIGWRIRPVS